MPKTKPVQVFVVDWDDDDVVLPYDHANALTPGNYDWEHGCRLNDIHSMMGLYGFFEVHDPDGLYDPVILESGTAERDRLEQPHRVWGYTLDSNTDSVVDDDVITGYCVIDKRPNNYTASFRLVPLDFVRLRKRITMPQFNVSRPAPTPPVRTGTTTQIEDPDGPVITNVSLVGLGVGHTTATLSVSADNVNAGQAFYFEYDNGVVIDSLSGTLVVTGDTGAATVIFPTTPGYTYQIRCSVYADYAYSATTSFVVRQP